MTKPTKTRRRLTAEQRQEAVELCLSEGLSCTAVALLHADNGNAMRAATLERRLEELGVLRSLSRPRGSDENP